MSLDGAEPDPDDQLMLVSIPRQAGTELKQAVIDGGLVSVWLPDYSTFDFNVVLLWIVAVGTFAFAGICAANDCKTGEQTLDDEVNSPIPTCVMVKKSHVSIELAQILWSGFVWQKARPNSCTMLAHMLAFTKLTCTMQSCARLQCSCLH